MPDIRRAGASTPPGPRGLPVVGSLLDFVRDPMAFMVKLGSYGDLAHFKMGPHSAYLVKKPQYLHEIFTKQADRVIRNVFSRRIAGKFVGDAVALLDGEHHQRDRKLMLPAFHHRRLEGYVAIMAAEAARMSERWAAEQELNVNREMQACSLSIATKTLFGTETDDAMGDIMGAMDDFQQVLAVETHSAIQLPDWLPIARKRRMRRAIEMLHGIVRKLIAKRRAEKQDKGDLLSMLLAAVDETTGTGMTDQQVHDEALFLFIAGHETTANLLAWVPYILHRHPSISAALYSEIDGALGNRPPVFADLAKLSYLEQICKETLRLYPSAWILSRTAAGDITLGPYTVPRGSSLFMSPFVTQREASYFPEPTQFRPERFAPGAEKSIPRYAYFPFGGGSTSCIGAQFAMLTAKIVLATVLQRYRLECLTTEEIRPAGLVTMRSDRDIIVRPQRR